VPCVVLLSNYWPIERGAMTMCMSKPCRKNPFSHKVIRLDAAYGALFDGGHPLGASARRKNSH
jgi:hypothetical protein